MNMTKLLPFFKVREDIKLILIMHDVGYLRSEGEILKEEVRNENYLYERACAIIVHNDIMRKTLIDYGVDKDKLVTLEIFDYIADVK